jgi:hypothetical protein
MYIQNVSNTFSWKRLINFIPIYSSPQYVYAFFLIEVYILIINSAVSNFIPETFKCQSYMEILICIKY